MSGCPCIVAEMFIQLVRRQRGRQNAPASDRSGHQVIIYSRILLT